MHPRLLKCFLYPFRPPSPEQPANCPPARQTERSTSARTPECAQKVAGRLGSSAENANRHDSELASKVGVRRADRCALKIANQKLEEVAGRSEDQSEAKQRGQQ